MSIINDALKKARRESVDSPPVPQKNEDGSIRPSRGSPAKSNTWIVLPAVFLVIIALGLIVVLGYLGYQEFYMKKVSPKPDSPTATEKAPNDPATEEEAPGEPEPSAAADPTPASPAPSTPTIQEAPAEAMPPPQAADLFEDFEINGVMRRGSSVRILTNSGVYRVGDSLKSPMGFTLESIEDNVVILKGPTGELYQLPLP
tara:strand:+ start:4347 stop:4949 length:603 start_codon:yes stop_codon:yes gene_type:complete